MNDALYQQAILELAKADAAAGSLAQADASATRDNPLCGDRVTLQARIEDGRVVELRQQTRGCALCQASASLVGRHAAGVDAGTARALAEAVRAYLKGAALAEPAWPELEAFEPVRARRSRHDCVTLAFDTLRDLFRPQP